MKKLYWKMYQDRNNMTNSVIITKKEMFDEISYLNNEMNEDEDFPVFEPVFITEEEYKSLPEFDGF